MLFPPEMDDAAITGEFKAAFDDLKRPDHRAELAAAAFDWLRTRGARASEAPVVFLNHPSRKAKDVAAVRTPDRVALEDRSRSLRWCRRRTRTSEHAAAWRIRGSPDPRGPMGPGDRPSGSSLGSAAGARNTVSGALATSDFHSTKNDYWPCQFSATWIYAPDRSAGRES